VTTAIAAALFGAVELEKWVSRRSRKSS